MKEKQQKFRYHLTFRKQKLSSLNFQCSFVERMCIYFTIGLQKYSSNNLFSLALQDDIVVLMIDMMIVEIKIDTIIEIVDTLLIEDPLLQV